jgi:hypothetical protein
MLKLLQRFAEDIQQRQSQRKALLVRLVEAIKCTYAEQGVG